MATVPKDSRAEILNTIRGQQSEPVELPSLSEGWVVYEDRFARFQELVERVGGRCLKVENTERIHEELNRLPAYAQAKKIVSLAPGIGSPNTDSEAIDDPHQLEDIDFVIARGEFGVAENGAIWVSDHKIRHRALYFLTQHLALIVHPDQILDNMHQAYDRLAFDGAGFGVFISGPSKTADIEQSLVIGAHGPRSLTVFCL